MKINYSAVIAVHNGEEFLGDAIRSMLTQSTPPLEILVVDDHSSDRSIEIAEETSSLVRILRSSIRGQAGATNLGVVNSASEYIAFLDHDDLWEEHKSENQLSILISEPDLEAVYGHVINFTGKQYKLAQGTPMGAARVLGAAMIRKRVFEKIGLFDEEINHHSIVEWWLRAERSAVTFAEDSEVALFRRVHESNSGVTHKDEARSALFGILRSEINRHQNGDADG